MVPRGADRPRTAVVHCARELCETCYSAASDAGLLDEHPRTTRVDSETLDAWRSLRALGATRADAARVLGMTYSALSKAISRG